MSDDHSFIELQNAAQVDDEDCEDINYPCIVPRPTAPPMSQTSLITDDGEGLAHLEFPDEEATMDYDQTQATNQSNLYPDLEQPETSQARRQGQRSSCGTSTGMSSRGSERRRSIDLRPASRASSSNFRTMPELSDHFEKISTGGGRKSTKCLHCNNVYSSYQTDRLVGHIIHKCTKVPLGIKERFMNIDKDKDTLSHREKDIRNRRFALIIVKHNIPLRLLDCEDFKSFMTDYCRGGPLASRAHMMSHYITGLAHEADRKFTKTVMATQDYSISIEFDHWTDHNNRLYLGVVATTGKHTRHLLRLDDVSIDGSSSDNITPSLRKALKAIPAIKINALVSDSASACVRARSLIASEKGYTHLMQHRCIAHWLNLIGSDLCKLPSVSSAKECCNELVRLLSTNSQISAKMSEAGAKKCKRSVATRWYSTVTMFESLLEVRPIAIQIVSATLAARIESGKESDKLVEALRLLQCEEMWPAIEVFVIPLRQIADCIATSEGKDSTLGQTMKSILNFARSILSSDWDDEYNFAAIESFFNYFNKEKLGEELGLMLAAYLLDRTNKMDFVTPHGQELILDAIGKVAAQTGIGKTCRKTQLPNELVSFINQEGTYGWELASEEESGLSWWLRQPETSVLRRVALRFMALKSSSANVERVFSTLNYIQSPCRLSFSSESLLNIAKIKVANFADADDLFDLGYWATDSSQSEERSDPAPSQSIIRRTIALAKQLTGQSRTARGTNNVHQPSKFTHIDRLMSYQYFIKLIDFTIVNSFESNPGDLTLDEPEEIVMEEARKRFREKLNRAR